MMQGEATGESVVAELSALCEISSLTLSDSVEAFAEEAMERTVRLFGLRRFALFGGPEGNRQLLARWGIRDSSAVPGHPGEAKPNQFYRVLGDRGELGELFMEQSLPIQYREGQLYAIFAGKVEEALAAARRIAERERAEERLERSFVDLAETISRAEAYRDPYSSSHQRRVAQLVRAAGEKMGLDRDRLLGLEIGGLLHDIGKASIPESILNKPGKLSQQEWSLVRLHARRGYEILQVSNLPWPVAEMALHHHERLDGSGYPDGISGDELSLDLRILAVCNVAEAMSAHRPYRPARSRAEIVEELRNGRGTRYDARVVDILLEMANAGALEADSPHT